MFGLILPIHATTRKLLALKKPIVFSLEITFKIAMGAKADSIIVGDFGICDLNKVRRYTIHVYSICARCEHVTWNNRGIVQ